MNQNSPEERFANVLNKVEFEKAENLEKEFAQLRESQKAVVAGDSELQALLDKALLESIDKLEEKMSGGELPRELIEQFLTFWENLNTVPAIRALAAEQGLDTQDVAAPAPAMSIGFSFEVTAAENLRDPLNHNTLLGRAEVGQIFKVVGELPARGQYEYRLVENQKGQRFKICINDDLKYRLAAEPVRGDGNDEDKAELVSAAPEQVEAQPFSAQGVAPGQKIRVSAADTLRTLDGSRSGVALNVGDEVTFVKAMEVSSKGYEYWEVEVNGEHYKLCINDTLGGTILSDSERVVSGAQAIYIPDSSGGTSVPEVSERDPKTEALRKANLEASESLLSEPLRAVYTDLVNQIQGLNIEDKSTLGASPVHITTFRGRPEISSGSWRKADTSLVSETWNDLTSEQRKEVVDMVNLWWNSNHADLLEPGTENRNSYITDSILRSQFSALSASPEAENAGSLADQVIEGLVNYAETNLNGRSVSLVAEGFQLLTAKMGAEYGTKLAQAVKSNPKIAISELYSNFCEAVGSVETSANIQDLINGVNFSELGIPATSRPFVVSGDNLVYMARTGKVQIDLGGQWPGLSVVDKAAVIGGLNDKIQVHANRYDRFEEALAKDILDLFSDYSVTDATQAVLARLRQEPNFLNTLPADRQDEAACAAFLTRYFDNVYGSRFSSFSNLGGKNAWEYAKTLIDSGYGNMGTDISSFYNIDSVRAQNEKDKSAITLDDGSPEFQAKMEEFMQSAFDPQANGGVVTFHYRLTSANDNIVNTPHASPNSHVTTSLGEKSYEVASTGRAVTAELMRYFAQKIGRHSVGKPEYLQYLKNVKAGDTPLIYDSSKGDFVGPDGKVFRPQSGEPITFDDVELAHFYHKHPDDADPVRRDGLVALMSTGLFEPVQVINLNPDAVSVPPAGRQFNESFVTSVHHSEKPMSQTDIESLYRQEYESLLSKQPGGSETVDSLVEKSMQYLTENLYQSILARSDDPTEKVFPADSPLPIIDWRQKPV